jgi:hypothetical protein
MKDIKIFEMLYVIGKKKILKTLFRNNPFLITLLNFLKKSFIKNILKKAY